MFRLPSAAPLFVLWRPAILRAASRPGAAALLSAAVLLGAAACDQGFPGSEGRAAVDRETFIQTYVDLRMAAIGAEGDRLPDAERERILARHGVTEDELRSFIEVHGRNVPYMHEVWAEVDRRITEARERGAEEPPPGQAPDGDTVELSGEASEFDLDGHE